MTTLTPIKEVDSKLDIIDHINQDHMDELLAMANGYCDFGEVVRATILEIYNEGVQIRVEVSGHSNEREVFVPFEVDGDLEEKILYLAYAAIIRSGKDLSGTGKRYFEVLERTQITPNFTRILVKCPSGLPDYYPGYAYAFTLKRLKKLVSNSTDKSVKKSWAKDLFDRLFLVSMKHLSSKNREKVIKSLNKGIRLYTLRQSWKENETDTSPSLGYIDVYTHESSPGSVWVDGLSSGDVIMSRSETDDKHSHLSHGSSLIIADETAFPAAAGILEHWDNEHPPQIVLLSAKQSEQSYFDGFSFPEGSKVTPIICQPDCQGERVLEYLANLESIDVVWGAFESESAKKVRHYLRNQLNVKGSKNHVKGYWKIK